MINIPKSHPRYHSLLFREKIIEGNKSSIVADAGVIAHGRGEAFDYLIGEKTQEFAVKAIEAAVANIILAKNPILSVNGNLAILCPDEIIKFSEISNVKLEINLFYRSEERESAIKNFLENAGAKNLLGLKKENLTIIDEIEHNRRVVDIDGIYKSDLVIIPLEDGDRAEILKKSGKKIIAVDLNPLSRTAIKSDITIVDNIVRVMKILIEKYSVMKNYDNEKLKKIINKYDNKKILQESLNYILKRLKNG